MTAKEKAEQLVKKYSCLHHGIEEDLLEKVVISDYAINSALIVVDEILKITWVDSILTVEDFWQEVKKEIELL